MEVIDRGAPARGAQDWADDLLEATRMAGQVERAASAGDHALQRLHAAVEQGRRTSHAVLACLEALQTVGEGLTGVACRTAADAGQAVEEGAFSGDSAAGEVRRVVSGGDTSLLKLHERAAELDRQAGTLMSAFAGQDAAIDEAVGAVAQLVEMVAALSTIEHGQDLVEMLRGGLLDDDALDSFLTEV
jgi:hypothetical protein